MDDQDQDQHQPRCHINSGDNWNELNEMTLSVMANRTRYDRYKKTVANTSDAVADNFCKEKTYYKDRILAMTSGLLTNDAKMTILTARIKSI